MDVIDEKRINNADQAETEIQLGDIIQFVKSNRRQMLIVAVIGLIVGALYTFSKPNMFKVEVTVMPEIQNKSAGSLGAVSAFAGLGLDNQNIGDAIRPDLYPNVLHSVPFALNLLNQPVYSKKLSTVTTLQEFINRTTTVSFLDKIFGFFATEENEDKEVRPNLKKDSQVIQMTKLQDGLVKVVQNSIVSLYDRKTGILTITITEPDPVVAATVAQLSLDYLTSYITAYRTEKARKRVIFLVQQVREAKQRYQIAEYTLSSYRDRNRSVFLNTAKLDEQRLQADYLLEQSVYSDLAKQLEQAKIKVQEDTPTFKTLEPPAIPLTKSGPRRTITTIGFAIAGVIISLSIAFARRILSRNQFK